MKKIIPTLALAFRTWLPIRNTGGYFDESQTDEKHIEEVVRPNNIQVFAQKNTGAPTRPRKVDDVIINEETETKDNPPQKDTKKNISEKRKEMNAICQRYIVSDDPEKANVAKNLLENRLIDDIEMALQMKLYGLT